MSIFRLLLVICFIFIFFSLFDVIIYIQKIQLFYIIGVFFQFLAVYCLFSYFVLIFYSNLYIIFIYVIKVVFFLTLYMQRIVGKKKKEYLLDITSSYT
jgi:hypothetical protein